ncbi:hypothetical protein H0H93_009391 [Arthromyces matolae]|nr:hypothetical protein H0H93_009391 [Arthromyces matolae]
MPSTVRSSKSKPKPQNVPTRALQSNTTVEPMSKLVEEPKRSRRKLLAKEQATTVEEDKGDPKPASDQAAPIVAAGSASVPVNIVSLPNVKDTYAQAVRAQKQPVQTTSQSTPTIATTPSQGVGSKLALSTIGMGASPLTALSGFKASLPRRTPGIGGVSVSIRQAPGSRRSPSPQSPRTAENATSEPASMEVRTEELNVVPTPSMEVRPDDQDTVPTLEAAVTNHSSVSAVQDPVTHLEPPVTNPTSVPAIQKVTPLEAPVASPTPGLGISQRGSGLVMSLHGLQKKLKVYNAELDESMARAETRKAQSLAELEAQNDRAPAATQNPKNPVRLDLRNPHSRPPLVLSPPPPAPGDKHFPPAPSPGPSVPSPSSPPPSDSSPAPSPPPPNQPPPPVEFSHVEIMTRPGGPRTTMKSPKPTKAPPSLLVIPTISDIEEDDNDNNDSTNTYSLKSPRTPRLQRSRSRDSNMTVDSLAHLSAGRQQSQVPKHVDDSDDILDIELEENVYYDFQSVRLAIRVNSVLVKIEDGEDEGKWADWQVLLDNCDDWCECPDGYRPDIDDREITRIRSQTKLGELVPDLKEELVFCHQLSQHEVVSYVGTLELGLHTSYDHRTRLKRWNDTLEFEIPPGFRAPRLDLLTQRKSHDADMSEGDSEDSYGEATLLTKEQDALRAGTPYMDTSDEDRELDKEFEKETMGGERRMRKGTSVGADADHDNVPRFTAQQKGKQKAVEPPSDNDEHSDDDDNLPDPSEILKGCGGRPSKEMIDDLSNVRESFWGEITGLHKKYNGRMSMATMANFVFKKPGGGKTNSFIVFKEYMSANPKKFQDIKTPEGKTPLERFNAKAKIAYGLRYGSLSDQEKLAYVDTMRKSLIKAKGVASPREMISALKRCGKEFEALATIWHQMWGFTIAGGIVPDSSDPAVQSAASIFYGNIDIATIVKFLKFNVRDALDLMAVLVKYVRYQAQPGDLIQIPEGLPFDLFRHESNEPESNTRSSLNIGTTAVPNERGTTRGLDRDELRKVLSAHWIQWASIILGGSPKRGIQWKLMLLKLSEAEMVVKGWPLPKKIPGINYDPKRLKPKDIRLLVKQIREGSFLPEHWPADLRALPEGSEARGEVPLVIDLHGNVLATVSNVVVPSSDSDEEELPTSSESDTAPPLPPQPTTRIVRPLPSRAKPGPKHVSRKRRRTDSDDNRDDVNELVERKEKRKKEHHCKSTALT